ncbi:DUF2231 domain-containing protein [Sphingomonas phyllosphaerae]|uniref:DUF2231 domain-containing protein n=1 Tax=Sphingomonas phyllosphaerae TaxID=257003 RepID=UPI0024131308|nr:DUF2231 domain-containing protein [Sphingomonas phyllosphaerae]
MASSPGRPALAPLALAGRPIYPVLLPVPITLFVAALVTDLAYAGSAEMMWLDFSSWLLLAGLIAGGLAGALLLVELVRAGAARRGALGLHFTLLLSAWIVEVLNSFIHARDGWTAVVPTGLALSVVAVLLALAAGWFWQAVPRRRSGDVR